VNFILPFVWFVYNRIYRNLLVETNQTTKLVARKSRNNISFDYPQESEVVAALPRNPSSFCEN